MRPLHHNINGLYRLWIECRPATNIYWTFMIRDHRGTSLIRNSTPPEDHSRGLGTVIQ